MQMKAQIKGKCLKHQPSSTTQRPPSKHEIYKSHFGWTLEGLVKSFISTSLLAHLSHAFLPLDARPFQHEDWSSASCLGPGDMHTPSLSQAGCFQTPPNGALEKSMSVLHWAVVRTARHVCTRVHAHTCMHSVSCTCTLCFCFTRHWPLLGGGGGLLPSLKTALQGFADAPTFFAMPLHFSGLCSFQLCLRCFFFPAGYSFYL